MFTCPGWYSQSHSKRYPPESSHQSFMAKGLPSLPSAQRLCISLSLLDYFENLRCSPLPPSAPVPGDLPDWPFGQFTESADLVWPFGQFTESADLVWPFQNLPQRCFVKHNLGAMGVGRCTSLWLNADCDYAMSLGPKMHHLNEAEIARSTDGRGSVGRLNRFWKVSERFNRCMSTEKTKLLPAQSLALFLIH